MRAFVIGGTHSGCGKTTVALGIAAALRKRGRVVQPFKAGPDFIDSGLHRLAAGRTSRNLDLWMCGEAYVRSSFLRNAAGADVTVIEGVMGLYDGSASTAHLAGVLAVPVVLVLDAYGMAESAAPIIKGMKDWGAERLAIEIKGVIFNRVASLRHYKRLCRGVEGVTLLGYLPRDASFAIPHRHLGLVVAEEAPIAPDDLDKLAGAVLEHIDLDALEALSASTFPFSYMGREGRRPAAVPPARIAVASDAAFCFYYADNIDLLREAGAEVVFFSPLMDARLPAGIDAVYIGGGYPELYGEALSANVAMLKDVRAWSEAGRPLYAECGGLMYLCRSIRDFEGRTYETAGVFPFDAVMERNGARLGYREVLLREGCALGAKGERIRGHEFRYSDIRAGGLAIRPECVYSVKNGTGKDMPVEGYRRKKTLASYIHVHFGSNEAIPGRFIAFAVKGRT
jgi:cobyrinic acid a,c-diamide synthase